MVTRRYTVVFMSKTGAGYTPVIWVYKDCLDAFYPTTDPMLFMCSIEKVRNLHSEKVLPAHHQLNISISLADEITNAFDVLYQQGKLRQGNGVFDFGGVSNTYIGHYEQW